MSEESPRSCLEPRLIFATGNTHKINEFKAVLAPTWQGYASGMIARTSDFNASTPLEGGATSEENSLIKARVLIEFAGLPVLTDDSGIYVDIIGEASGISSACWCDARGNNAANLDLPLAQPADVPSAHRGTVSVSAAALVLPDGREFIEHGKVRGILIRERRDEDDFSYDPILTPKGYSHTSAEFSPEGKNAISHRGKAFRALLPTIIEALKDK